MRPIEHLSLDQVTTRQIRTYWNRHISRFVSATKMKSLLTTLKKFSSKLIAESVKNLDFFPIGGHGKIAVEIYPDARGLARATGLTIRQIETSGTIAVCKYHRLMIISPLAAANGYSWADTLAHEFIHLVISKKSRNKVPIWLHGLAKYYESSWRTKPGQALSASSKSC